MDLDPIHNYTLPYDFDLFLDCKNMEQLIKLHREATDTLETIYMLAKQYPEVGLIIREIQNV